MSINFSIQSTSLYLLYMSSNILLMRYFDNSFTYFMISTFMYFTCQYELYEASKQKKLIYIVRGFPGCGKTLFIKDKFKNKNIKLFDNYDLKNREFENLYLQKEKKFIDLFKHLYKSKNKFTKKIVVVSGFFPTYNSISNIIYLVDTFNYNVVIVTFDNAGDKNDVKYLLDNSSIKKLNKSYIFKNFNTYEESLLDNNKPDSNEIFVANFNDCEGDSIPYPKKSKEELDRELEIMKNAEKE